MPQMTPSEARGAVDPILTEVARGYSNADFVGSALFPAVPVGKRGGKIIEFGREAFRLYNTARAPGTNIARIVSSYSTRTYALADHSIAEQVPVELMEEAETEPGIDLAAAAVRRAQDVIGLRLEKAQADLARDPTRYPAGHVVTLSGTSQWSDYTGSDPIRDVEDWKELVRAKIGRRPTVLLVGAAVFAALKHHPKVVERVKYTSREVATPELLAELFGLRRVVVGEAVYLDDAGNTVDVWGKDAVLAYTDSAGIADAGRPSYGYTYRLRGYPVVEEGWYDRDTRSWVYPVHDAVAPVIVGPEAGVLVQNAVA